MSRMPWSKMTASSPAKAGSQALQLGMVAATKWLEPSWCCKPSPPSVVRPDVAPNKNPRACWSAAAQIWSPTR